jgi:hypothetical protein
MTLPGSLRHLALAVATVASSLAFSAQAAAGTLQVRDDEHVLSATDTAKIRSVVGDAPFDARLVFTSGYADAQDLGRFVGSLVDEPNMVVVGVDSQHRHVQVHFGRGTGIARPEWSAVETAGNDDFRSGRWADGAAAIFRTAAHDVTGAAAPAGNAGSRPFGAGSLLLLLLLFGGGIALIAMVVRRFTSPRVGPAGYGYGGPGYGPGGYPGGYGGPGPYGAPGGIGPLGAGAIGAGLGGLAGYELGKLEGEREGHAVVDDRSDVAPPDDSFDAGGGGSSWDDGGGGGNDSGSGNDGGGSDF